MLGKLMKYEIKSTARILLPLYITLLVISVVNRFVMKNDLMVPTTISAIVYGALILAIFVLTLILMIQRFSKNLLGSEGYLMFTLPVSTDSLIMSKLIISAMWVIAGVIVSIVTAMIMVATAQDMTQFWTGMSEAFRVLSDQLGYNIVGYVIEAVVLMIAWLLAGILVIYASIALGTLANKHRGLWAFGAFIIINIILSNVGNAIFKGVRNIDFNVVNGDDFTISLLGHAAMFSGIIGALVICVVLFAVTRYILKRRLNLE